ncbi:hypothetical protein ACFLYJ_03480 [Candidatus Cloacimonadota bacterium]
MRNVLIVLVVFITLTACQSISNSDRIIISKQAEKYFNIPEYMEKSYNTNDSLFKSKMKLHIDSLYASPLKEEWQNWIDEGSLNSCYYSWYTRLIENRKLYQDTLQLVSKNTFQYIAKLNNHYSYDSEYDDINFKKFKEQNITNTTYEILKKEIDDFYENFIHFTLVVNLKEQVKLNFVKSNNNYLISSVENEELEMEIEVMKQDD